MVASSAARFRFHGKDIGTAAPLLLHVAKVTSLTRGAVNEEAARA